MRVLSWMRFGVWFLQDPLQDHCGEFAVPPGPPTEPVWHPSGRICQAAWRSWQGHASDLWPEQKHSRLSALYLHGQFSHNPGPAAGLLQVSVAQEPVRGTMGFGKHRVTCSSTGLPGNLTHVLVWSTFWWRCRVFVEQLICTASQPWASTFTSRRCCVPRWVRLTPWRHSR